MRTFGTVVAVILGLLWSAVIWGGYGLLLMTTSFVTSNAGDVGLPPDVAGWAGMLDGLLRDYGTGATAAVWAIGLLAILALRALFNLAVGPSRPSDVEPMPRPVPAAPQARTPQSLPPPVFQPAATTPAPAAPGPSRWGRDARR